RTGINTASGDDNPGDDVHRTFFNALPSNFFYYGMANQVTFQNLVNWFAQLRLNPAPGLAVQVFLHRFWLANANDSRYFGPGAFNRSALGFNSSPSNGSRDVGTEVDLIVTYRLGGQWSLFFGYAYLKGGDVFQGKDTHWASTQVAFKY
ncbi:MAG: alginate export family protein, partial [Candidatus Tectomicrobia bacterium]|nr:alginate export family protein [Candidatus Tectomicrobia bacterium]